MASICFLSKPRQPLRQCVLEGNQGENRRDDAESQGGRHEHERLNERMKIKAKTDRIRTMFAFPDSGLLLMTTGSMQVMSQSDIKKRRAEIAKAIEDLRSHGIEVEVSELNTKGK